MTIRKDLKEVEGLISRLISIGSEFKNKDSWWSHLKNKEDWEHVWSIKDKKSKAKIERIYADGRDMGLFMSNALESINSDFSTYPTLTSIIDRFNKTWVNLDLEPRLQEAIKAHDSLDINLWAFKQMTITFLDQMSLADVVRQTLELLKNSDLYKQENGIPMKKDNPNITISDVTNSNIAVHSNHVKQEVENNKQIFNEIIEAIKSSDIEHKESLITAAETMQKEYGSGSFNDSYKGFINLAANHMSIIAPFLPALSALL